ncbi:polyprenyl diphosphate synthase [Acanthopleuribacter pedis]|uniref:Isoprenyl transferase n=1 Tax=Acanthopleuribacter pedis TaxID=442870 RepID=A0A8J7QPB4_9BACT|nr:polyprenyl diphosphate synthase [Acanthopleuribacter pedis]MBO1322163.1 di-trans,poly-cis-decaprenylcistransferase [Acanthopleuribacter pedis]
MSQSLDSGSPTDAPYRPSQLKLTREEQLLHERIDFSRLPKHIAIIMDGNGRWAKSRNFSRIKGHKAAIPSVRQTVEGCVDLGIQHLTLYAFSTENWKRPAEETGTLMALLRQFLRVELKTVRKHNLRVNVIGALHELSPGIQRDIETVFRDCRDHQGMCFNIAVNYSGRNDILAAFQAAVADGVDPADLNEARFHNYLSTSGQPDPDLVIRTSGEMRISNFLLWQIAYSEIYVTPTLWPDFGRADLYRAVLEYQTRHRRFGGI